MAMHGPPEVAQRRHSKRNASDCAPDQDPGFAVNVRPTSGSPTTLGGSVAEGPSCGTAATVAVVLDGTDTTLAAFVAVTTTRRERATSS
jgi:hypothetical protein